MINRLLFIGIATLLLSSCGPKEFTPCECEKIISGKDAPEGGIEWCNTKINSDENFAEKVEVCTAEALGYDTSKSEISSSNPLQAAPGKYVIDIRKSAIKWTGRKTTGSHTGKVRVKSGEFTLKPDGSIDTGNITIDMNGLTVTDIEDADSNADLVGHLKADDFFGVANFPEAMYNITSATLLEGGNGTNYKVDGRLTIKGITKTVSCILVIVKSKAIDGNVSLAGGLTFDRTDFGIKYNSGKFFDSLGDKLIDDNVTLQVTLVASKR